MKTLDALSQKILSYEYPYAVGYLRRDRAAAAIEDLLAEAEISTSERPRTVAYAGPDGAPRWAIVLTDTALQAYA
jgi:hypothetical protein